MFGSKFLYVFQLGRTNKAVCDGYTVIKADEATFNEASGEVQAKGGV